MQWTGKTGGTTWQQRALIVLFKHVDIRVIYGVMSIWLLWYMIVRPSATRAVFHFHRRRKRTRLQACLDTYHSYFCFGQAIMDRFAVYAGCTFHIDIHNMPLFANLRDGTDGFIVLFSHLGNSEMAGYGLATPYKKMNVLTYAGETETVMRNRTNALQKNNLWLISMLPNSMNHIYAVNSALERGEIVAMAADRITQSKHVDCPFLGQTVHLPAGPFHICTTMQKPVLLVFVFKTRWNKYEVKIQQLQVDMSLPRSQRIQDIAQQYATALEQQTLQYPYQWFNYYDFWKQ